MLGYHKRELKLKSDIALGKDDLEKYKDVSYLQLKRVEKEN